MKRFCCRRCSGVVELLDWRDERGGQLSRCGCDSHKETSMEAKAEIVATIESPKKRAACFPGVWLSHAIVIRSAIVSKDEGQIRGYDVDAGENQQCEEHYTGRKHKCRALTAPMSDKHMT